ncbi:homeodomain-like protein [Tanacetum coccineum]
MDVRNGQPVAGKMIDIDGKLKDEALKNKAIMEGMIDDDDESHNNGWKRWDNLENTNRDHEEREYEMQHEDEERCELFDDQERPVCNIRRFETIKYSFGDDEEYVVVKENEYDDLMSTRKEAIHAYQEIILMMDEGWMDLAGKEIDEVGEVSIIWNPMCVVCMTRSSTKELLTPFKEPEREFRSSRKLFKTLSLDESRLPEYNLFFDLEENSEEEFTEIMVETMDQYMSKTRANYGSGIAGPKIDMTKITLNKKANFLRNYETTPSAVRIMKMRTNTLRKTRSTETFDGLAAIQAQLNNLRREIKKVNKKVYAAQVGCKQCKGHHYTKNCPLKEEGKTLEEAYYTQFGAPFQQGGQYRAAALGFYQRNNANPLHQE